MLERSAHADNGRILREFDLGWLRSFAQFLDAYRVSGSWILNADDRAAIAVELNALRERLQSHDDDDLSRSKLNFGYLAMTADKALGLVAAFESDLSI